jgi:hypothetical protein
VLCANTNADFNQEMTQSNSRPDFFSVYSAEEGEIMGEMRVEKSGVVPASKTVDREISDQEDQNHTKTEGPVTKPAVGRLPARASRS